jgi:Zn-dependent peptidase ImmA (M78 family)
MPPRKPASIEEQAEELRHKLGITGVPVPVERMARALGAQLRYSPLDDEISGMIFIRDGAPIIGVNSLHHAYRQRFTIAHEIAHLTLHRDRLAASVHVDKTFRILHRDEKSAMGTDGIEIAANQFAASLLVPRSVIDAEFKGKSFDIDDDSPLDALSKKLRVSKQLLGYRIRNLEKAA